MRVHLLQHLVDVNGVGLLGLLPLLAIGTNTPAVLLGWKLALLVSDENLSIMPSACRSPAYN